MHAQAGKFNIFVTTIYIFDIKCYDRGINTEGTNMKGKHAPGLLALLLSLMLMMPLLATAAYPILRPGDSGAQVAQLTLVSSSCWWGMVESFIAPV